MYVGEATIGGQEDWPGTVRPWEQGGKKSKQAVIGKPYGEVLSPRFSYRFRFNEPMQGLSGRPAPRTLPFPVSRPVFDDPDLLPVGRRRDRVAGGFFVTL